MIIEKNVPFPVDMKPVGRPSTNHFDKLEVGDSWWNQNKTNLWYARQKTGFSFAQRKETRNGVAGYRTWRTK